MLGYAIASRPTFGATRVCARRVNTGKPRRSRVVRVARPRPVAAEGPDFPGDTSAGDLSERAEAMIEDVERSGGDPADLLRRTIIRDIDIPEPAEEHETFAERARRIGEEGSSYDEALERSDHDPTAESAFERPSASSDPAWDRLAGDIEKLQDDAAIHYAKYEGAKRAAADRASAQGRNEAIEKNEEGLKGWNETTDGPAPTTGTRRHTPTSANAKCGVCRYGYDPNLALQRGENYAPVEYNPEETLALHDEPNAPLDEIVPPELLEVCSKPDDGYRGVVLMQGFDWVSSKTEDRGWWRRLLDMVPDIAAAGVTHLWLPPPSHSVSPEGYLPGHLWNLDSSAYGSMAELVALNAALNKAGIVSVCDIVINHRTADEKGPEGVYNVYSDEVDHAGTPVHWGRHMITCNDPEYHGSGHEDSGDNYDAAPDLDHANEELRTTLKRWLRWLRADVGFGGFRFDFVRGYAPEYTEEYVKETTSRGDFCVGENWVDLSWEGSFLNYNQDGPRGKLVEWLAATHGTCALFDFPTKGILQRAVEHGEFYRLRDPAARPAGLLGWVPSRAVTFVDNHDTGEPQNHWPFPADRLALGYAYILTHPGIPCVFGPHLWDENDPVLSDVIKRLIDLRRRCCVCPDARVRILMAEDDLYVAKVGKMLTVKLGPRFEMPVELLPNEPEWSLAVAGEDFAVWERVEYQSEPVAAMEEKMRDVGDDGEYYPLERVVIDNSRQSIGSWFEPPARNVEPSDGEADPR